MGVLLLVPLALYALVRLLLGITCSGCGGPDKSKHTCTGKAWDGRSLQEMNYDCDCPKQ